MNRLLSPVARDALEGKAPQGRPQGRLGRRLEGVAVPTSDAAECGQGGTHYMDVLCRLPFGVVSAAPRATEGVGGDAWESNAIHGDCRQYSPVVLCIGV